MTEATWPGPDEPMPHRVVRRHYLIDPRRQLRAVVMTTSVVAVLVILVNVGFALLRLSQSSFLSAVAPQLGHVLDRQDTTYSWVMILFSVVLVAAVSAKTIVDTHRTAGAVFAVKQRLERVRQGDLHVTLKLRRNDDLQDLEQPFNEMVSTLRDRALDEASQLDKLAAKAVGMGAAGQAIAQDLQGLADFRRQVGS
jgi:methyl-accepting chemotaxis protein